MKEKATPEVEVEVQDAPVTEKTKPKHPSFASMVAEAFMDLDKTEPEHHGHGFAAIKHVVGSKHPDLPEGWEKHLSAAFKSMVTKKMLVHGQGSKHPGMYRLSKSLKAKEEKKEMRAMNKAERKVKAPAKAKSPAKRAKKADAKPKA